MQRIFIVFTFSLGTFLCENLPSIQASDTSKEASDPSEKGLKEVIKALHQGMATGKKEEQIRAFKATFPTKKDIELLFPKHAAKLWSMLEAMLNKQVDNIDKVAHAITQGGPIEQIDVHDIRKDSSKSYKRLLQMIPQEIPVYRYVVKKKSRTSGGGCYLFVHERWIFIQDLDALPEVIDQLEKQ